jgi:hypothetical protein
MLDLFGETAGIINGAIDIETVLLAEDEVVVTVTTGKYAMGSQNRSNGTPLNVA